MWHKKRILWILAKLTCTALLIVQLVHVLGGFIKPTITRTWEEELPLQVIDFPLVIKVCVSPAFNQTALHEVGYQNSWSYFAGLSKFNSTVLGQRSMLGWAGHTEDSGTYGTVEGVLAKIIGYKMENIFNYVLALTSDGWYVKIPLKHLNASRVTYPDNCLSLSLPKIPELKDHHIWRLYLDFGQLGNQTIKISFNGETLDTVRYIGEHNFESLGDSIHSSKEGVYKAYRVEISQRVFVEEDPTNNCQVYPNKQYQSYQDCDDHFVRKLLPGLTPIWMTEDFAEVSTQVFDENGTYGELMFL